MAALRGWGASEHTAAGGTCIHAAAMGDCDAPTVVCVHGLGCSHRYFFPVARLLSARARVVAPDLPGFGRTRGFAHALDVRGLSSALADWLRVTGRAGAVLLANSAGCQVVVDLAVHAGDLLGPVILAGPTIDRHARTAREQLCRLLANQRWERPSLGPVLARDWLACGPRRYAQTLNYLLDDPVEHKLGNVRTHTVVVRGSNDPIASPRWAREVVAALPAGHLAEVPGAGHTLNWSAPRELARLVHHFL